MNLLKAILYDPPVAVSKATSALLAMTAFDTTNLRLAITVPAHGMVRFRLRCTLTGATTFPTILLGVLNGATVIMRVAPVQTLGNTAVATAYVTCDAEATVTGLTPGAMNVDAAYGVETIVASTNIKYGGPNNTTANDACGGFVFEAWDPQPLTGDAYARLGAPAGVSVSADIAAINAKTTNLPAAPASTTNITAGTITSITGNVGGNVVGSVASVAATVNADVKKINGITIVGNGSSTPFNV